MTAARKTEVIQIKGDDSKPIKEDPNLDLAISAKSATGGMMSENIPLICGGISDLGEVHQHCWILGQKFPQVSMQAPRYYAASVVITVNNRSILWVTGGNRENDLSSAQSTTELVQLDRSEFGPNLPKPLARHCILKVSDREALITGGSSGKIWHGSPDTLRIQMDPAGGFSSMEQGPPMMVPRRNHACGLVETRTEPTTILAVVVGGNFKKKGGSKRSFTNHHHSVELLTTTNLKDSAWKAGPEIPRKELAFAAGLIVGYLGLRNK